MPVAQGVNVDRLESRNETSVPPPYVVKPVREGSSFGVVIVQEGR